MDAQVSQPANAVPKAAAFSRGLARNLLIVVCFLGTILRMSNLGTVVNRSPDERSYTWEASTLLHQGKAGVATIVAAQQVDTSLPGPTRASYLFLLARAMQITGDETPATGAMVSCIASVIAMVLLALIAWRFFSPAVALTAVTLYAASPVSLMTARRSWQEALVEMMALTLILLAAEIASGKRGLAWFAGFAAIGGFCVGTKEVAAGCFLLCGGMLMAVLLWRHDWKAARLLGAFCTASVALALGWLTWLVGGVHALLQLSTVTSRFLASSPYSMQYEGGPPWLLLEGFWVVSAGSLVLFLLGLTPVIRRHRPWTQEQYAVIALAIFVFSTVGLALVVPHHLNLRYVSAAEGPFCLLAGVGLKQVLAWIGKFIPKISGRPLQGAAAVVIFVVAAHDYSTFLNGFAEPDLQDLSIRMVLGAGGIVLPPIVQPVAPVQPLETYAQKQLTAAQWVDLSRGYAQANRNDDSIVAARKALALEPGNAVAWNNIAAANENMQHWDEAIAAAQQALKLQPDFQLAKNNLAWSLEQKRKQAGK